MLSIGKLNYPRIQIQEVEITVGSSIIVEEIHGLGLLPWLRELFCTKFIHSCSLSERFAFVTVIEKQIFARIFWQTSCVQTSRDLQGLVCHLIHEREREMMDMVYNALVTKGGQGKNYGDQHGRRFQPKYMSNV